MTPCHSDCDCGNPSVKYYGPHEPDCHSHVECNESGMCDRHEAEAIADIADHAWMRHVSLGAVTGVMSEQDKQDIIDAGRGHLL